MFLTEIGSNVKRGVVSLLCVVSLLLSTIACERRSENNQSLSVDQTEVLVISNGREPVTLDPHQVASWADLRVIEGLFEGLVVVHPETKIPVGGVADYWEKSNESKSWRFRIRENAKWSDGTAITAEDFVQSAKRMLNPEFGSEFVVHLLYPLKNAEAYHRGTLRDFREVGIAVESERSLNLELEYSSPAILTQLSYFFPVNEADFQEGEYFDGKRRWGRGGTVCSNGAYILDSWVTNERISLVKNPHYWDSINVHINRIDVLPIEDSVVEERAFRNGQIQITSKVPAGKMQWYLEHDSDRLRVEDRMGLFFIQLNHSVYPLNDINVRRALAKSIDRQGIVESVLRDGKKAAARIVLPELLGGDEEDSPLSYDIEVARDLLAEAGFPEGAGFPRLTFLINTSTAYQALAEAVQYSWRKHLGIEWRSRTRSGRCFLVRLNRVTFRLPDMAMFRSILIPIRYFKFLLQKERTISLDGQIHITMH